MKSLAALCAAAFVLFTTVHAQAQATRTWVSGVGDDANPGSRTAPCKTFAGAISKTAVAGVINVVDPGGFGAVTITKSITIDSGAALGSVLVFGTNGIIINGAATDVVVLRNLDFQGLGTSISGIYILAAGTVIIENCEINGFTRGITVSTNANVIIKNTVIRNNTATADSAGSAGILVNADGAKVTVLGSTITANSVGISAAAASNVYVGDSSIIANIGAGLANSAGGKIISLKNNHLTGNSPDGKFAKGAILPK
jgi:hypothetical protein